MRMDDLHEDRATEYRAKAEHCRRMAEDAKTQEVRSTFLQLANQWEEMARGADRTPFPYGSV